MTDNKRFTREEDSDYIRDNQTDKRVLYVCDIVDDLNELNDEKEQYKRFIKQLTNTREEIVLMNGNVYKVNKIIGDLE